MDFSLGRTAQKKEFVDISPHPKTFGTVSNGAGPTLLTPRSGRILVHWVLGAFADFPRKNSETRSSLRGHVGPLGPNRAFLKGGDLVPGERLSRDTRDDGTVTLYTLSAAMSCHAIVAKILVVP